jgi:hypothetical protein
MMGQPCVVEYEYLKALWMESGIAGIAPFLPRDQTGVEISHEA